TVLKDARQKFRSVLVEATVKLDELVKKIGKAVEDSKPYWEARRVARQVRAFCLLSLEVITLALNLYQDAVHPLTLAQRSVLPWNVQFCLEINTSVPWLFTKAVGRVIMVDTQNSRVSATKRATPTPVHCIQSQVIVNNCSLFFHRPYFELKAKYYVQLEQLKKTVDDLQAKLALAKGEYKTALKNLEMISDEIHERRRSTAMGPRGCGVGAEGSTTSVEDLSASKAESDTVSMASEVFEDDNGSSFVSEEDSETQSVSSFSSGPTSPCEVPTQFPPATRPGSLDLPSPVSLSEFGMIFPVLGPRSECSGASSPECEAERGDRAEGAENKTSDRVNKNRSSTRSSSTEGLALDNRMKQLSLQCMKIKEGICAGRKAAQIG
ncbi:3BP5 protein, partial [Leiothrix lutea]|nr:3BP5 protein [Leiothrix lutea]